MSSVKFQGHKGKKIDNLAPISAFLDDNYNFDLDLIWDYKSSHSYQIPQICLVMALIIAVLILFLGGMERYLHFL